MPRHVNKTSYGQVNGNDPTLGGGGDGCPPKMMRTRMQLIAARAKTLRSMELVLNDPDHKHFGRVLDTVLDRGYGKPEQAIDLTSEGARLVSGVIIMPPSEPLPAAVREQIAASEAEDLRLASGESTVDPL